jgi:anaerobic sulfite reductase subunit B
MKKEIIKNSPYKPHLVSVLDYQGETPDSFTIKLDWKMRHEPGQFIFCSIPGIGEAPISICSYSEEYVELNIREVGNVTNALSKLKKGDKLLVRGPYGRPYPMEHFKCEGLIIVGGGSGVDPLKGVIEYIERHRNEFKDVSLFFGFRTPDDILFRHQLDVWKKEFNVHVSFDKLEAKTFYEGRQGFVTQFVDEQVHDHVGKVAFICGPSIMIEKTATILLGKGFNPEQIYIGAERLMYCGIGKCGRCMIHGKYTCLDGAVFRYDELKGYRDD